MLTLLSPAKKLDLDPISLGLELSQPSLPDDTHELAKIAKQQSAQDLKRLMHISDALAQLNTERFQSFTLSGKSNSAKPAALAFNGDVYKGLDASSLDEAGLIYAQDHLRILSGLYGILRPLDAMQPYRLEMGTKLENPRGPNLYKFWGHKISDILMQDIQDHKGQAILNLASNEYFKAVDKKAINVPIITANFLNIKDGNAKNISFYAKKARGLMARWVIDNRIENPSDLGGFNAEGYALDKGASKDGLFVFSRTQPPPASKVKKSKASA